MGYQVIDLSQKETYRYVENSECYSADELDSKNIIYIKKGKKVTNDKIVNTNFTKFVKNKLNGLNCKFSNVGMNTNLFSNEAEIADGLFRICYLRNNAEKSDPKILEVYECKDSQTASYSALYYALIEELANMKVPTIKLLNSNTNYGIKEEHLPLFVRAVNNVVQNLKNGVYILTVSVDVLKASDFEKRYDKVDGNKDFFHKVYWRKQSSL